MNCKAGRKSDKYNMEKDSIAYNTFEKGGGAMSIEEIGCCGAYCRTCHALTESACQGCKLRYSTGERDIKKAKCKMKVCCVTKGFISCADCESYGNCSIIREFHNKNGYKYGKYHQAIEYIKENGYEQFMSIADKWGNAYGKYE